MLPLNTKTAGIITAEVMNKLGQDGQNLEDCRGQVYGNQATVASV
jgi:hypothetical protein